MLHVAVLAGGLVAVPGLFGGEGFKELTPREAYELLSGKEGAVLVDMRSQAEYALVGHPTMAYNVPTMFWDAATYSFVPNPDFGKDLASRFDRQRPILFICRSGGRSAKAAQMAVSLGFEKVYNVVEGFEGEPGADGHRTVNGWKNAGLPYTYQVKDELRYRPSR